jgi:hypothetical protein
MAGTTLSVSSQIPRGGHNAVNIDRDLEKMDRSLRRWRTLAVVHGVLAVFLGVALIGCWVWGYKKNVELDRAIVEAKKVGAAIKSLRGALGVARPSEQSATNENEVAARESILSATEKQ